jgi:hypothetical protein
MKAMRRILRDRSWNGAIVVSLAYLMVLQGLILGTAHGAMAAAAAHSPSLICTSKGVVSVLPVTGDDMPASDTPHWHCATLCQLASTITPAVLGGEAGLSYALRAPTHTSCIPPDSFAPSSWPGRVSPARGPPSSI